MIDLDDAKRHLNLTTDDDDVLVMAKIAAASAWLGSYIGATYEQTEIDDDSGDTYTVVVAPAPVKEACRQLVAHLYANREASLVGVTAQALPFGLLDLLSSYRAYAF